MSPRSRVLLGTAVLVAVGAVAVGFWYSGFSGTRGSPHDQASALRAAAQAGPLVPSTGPTPTHGASPATVSPSPPARLDIPVLNVDATAEAVGVDSQGRMAVPAKAEDVGWYQLGPSPGQAGNAVIDGHLDWWTGPAVFWNLGRLKIGDEVYVARADGVRVMFVVDEVSTVPYDSRPTGLFATSGPPSLSLITCSGFWDRQKQTYTTRLVVHASLAPPKATQTPGDGG